MMGMMSQASEIGSADQAAETYYLIENFISRMWRKFSAFLSRPDTEKKLLIALVMASLVVNILSVLARRREEKMTKKSVHEELGGVKKEGTSSTGVTTTEEEKQVEQLSSGTSSNSRDTNSLIENAIPEKKIQRFDCETAARQRRLCVPLARWNNAVQVNDIYFVSAQFGADDFGVLLPTAELQCIAAFKNLERALRDGGRTALDVAKLTVHMVHGKCGISQYRSAEARFFPRDALPAVTIIFVTSLATENIFVQIEAVAA